MLEHLINNLDDNFRESSKMSRRQFLIDLGLASGALIAISSLPAN